MALLYPKPRQRYDRFRLNPSSPLYRGLVFAGLGGQGCVGSMVYPDSSPYHHNGTLTNMDAATDWVWVPQLSRFALDFDGSNDYVTVPRGSHDWTGTVTVACWYFPRVETNGCTFGFNYDREFDCRLMIGGTASFWYQSNGADGYDEYKFPATSLNAWGHNCIFRDSATKQIKKYNNGNPVVPLTAATYTNTPYSSTYPFYIGRRYSGRYDNAIISDLCVWLRVLFPAEIAALADPSNVDLRVGGTPLLVPLRPRVFRVASVPTATSDIAGTAGLTVGASGTASGLASATGSAAVSLDAGGAATGLAALAGSTGLDLSVAGALARRVAISGGAGLLVSPSGRMSGLAGASGRLETALTVDAHLGGLVCLRGEASLQIDAAGRLSAPRYLLVDAAEVFNAGAEAAQTR